MTEKRRPVGHQGSISGTTSQSYLAGLANPTVHSTPIGTTD
jgi:hypothetical protein